MKSAQDFADGSTRATSPRGCIAFYLSFDLAWWAIAMFAISSRIASLAWRPIFDVFFAQAVLFDAIVPTSLVWAGRLAWLATEVLLAVLAWTVVEGRKGRQSVPCWRRALLSCVIAQGILVLLGLTLGE